METILDSEGIKKLLPHRYPFLLVDRIIELAPLQRIVGIKQVSINESFFQGHFPGAPVMPGVLVIEALAQCGAILALREIADRSKTSIHTVRNQFKAVLEKTGADGQSHLTKLLLGLTLPTDTRIHTGS